MCRRHSNEIFRLLDKALEELRFQDRVIFVPAELEGLSYAVARIKGQRHGTVKSRGLHAYESD